MLVSPGYEQIYFPLHPSLTTSYRHDNSWEKFRIYMMSGPELPHNIFSSEDTLACLRSIKNDYREMRLGLKTPTFKKTVASSDLDPDPSSGIDYGGVITQGFRGPSNHQWDQTMLRNFMLQMQPQAVPVSYFYILTKPTSKKTVVSSDTAPDPSAENRVTH